MFCLLVQICFSSRVCKVRVTIFWVTPCFFLHTLVPMMPRVSLVRHQRHISGFFQISSWLLNKPLEKIKNVIVFHLLSEGKIRTKRREKNVQILHVMLHALSTNLNRACPFLTPWWCVHNNSSSWKSKWKAKFILVSSCFFLFLFFFYCHLIKITLCVHTSSLLFRCLNEFCLGGFSHAKSVVLWSM